MSHINQAAGEAVDRVIREHGLSLRQARIRTGIDIDTLGRMRSGEVVRMDKVVAFARGFRLPVNEWLELYGYEPVEDTAAEATLDGADTFYEEFRRLQADYPHLPIPLPHFSGGVRSIKGPDEAREIVAGMRRRVEQGLFGDPRRPVM
jgi:hypothetical protein